MKLSHIEVEHVEDESSPFVVKLNEPPNYLECVIKAADKFSEFFILAVCRHKPNSKAIVVIIEGNEDFIFASYAFGGYPENKSNPTLDFYVLDGDYYDVCIEMGGE